jgi:very-short-patch-repair endonuclease
VESARAALAEARSLEEALRADTQLPAARSLPEWDARIALVERANQNAKVFTAGLFAEDLHHLTESLAPAAESGWKRFTSQIGSGEYRAARRRANDALTAGATIPDLPHLHRLLLTARDLADEWGLLCGVDATPCPSAAAPSAAAASARFRERLSEIEAICPGLSLTGREFGSLDTLLSWLEADTGALRTAMEVRQVEDALGALGLASLLDEARRDRLDRNQALERLEWVWLTSIIEEVSLTDRHVGVTAGPVEAANQFRRSDREHIASGPERVRRAVAERAVRARELHQAEAVLIQRQAKLKPRSRKHLSVREFFDQAPHALRALKPCWAMSPLVVSQTLPAKRDLFDVVIFDEASQIPPPDAVPAILRGRRLVVAGDSRQLPPTTFFTAALAEGEDDFFAPDAGTEGYESILDALTGLIPERMLTWHYRSQDERLIAFSNVHIYDRSLTTFPGVTEGENITHELVSVNPAEDLVEESSSAEVRRVCELILEHARERPHETLGVITMGIKHAERIEEALRRMFEQRDDEDEHGEEFFSERQAEPFFIKNLERVQGDERDAIILSIGYGKDPQTGRLLYRFGPLLQDGGERRLNVAITRARRRIAVISSFSHEDMDPEKSTRPGVALLRRYLAYAAAEGVIDTGPIAELPPELNPFERQVRDALAREGVPLTPQLGVSGYRVDLALRHPDRPGRYVLAVECDGASYHSSPIARERDRLRQEQLERIGWRFHRIWSSEWFADPRGVTERVVAAWRRAVIESDADEEADPAPFDRPPPPAPRAEAAGRPRGPRPLRAYRSHEHRDIVEVVRWVESDTLLRTRDELAAEVLAALGFERAGSRIGPAILEAIDEVRGGTAPPAAFHGAPPKAVATTSTASSSQTPSPKPSAHRASGPASRPAHTLPLARGGSPSSQEVEAQSAIRIAYRRRNSNSSPGIRVVNPLIVAHGLMWAWCHKRSGIRCFRLDGIASWEPATGPPPPQGAMAAAEAARRQFVSASQRRRW